MGEIGRVTRRTVWLFIARALTLAATAANATAAFLLLRDGNLYGLLNVGFVLAQPTLYRAMTYGL